MKSKSAARTTALLITAIALIAPATANATEWWWFDHKQGRFPVSTFKKVVEPTLNAFWLTNFKGKKLGPCEGITIKGEIYNKFNGMGEGDLTQVHNTLSGCSATASECTVKKLEPVVSPAWKLTLIEKEKEGKKIKKVQISNFALTVEKTGKCEDTEIPNEFKMTGTVEGRWLDHGTEGGPFIEFEGFEVDIGETSLWVDGSLGFGTELTTKVEPTGFTPAESPTVLKGESLGSIVFKRGESTVTCEVATLDGTAKAGDTTVTVTPTYSSCKSGLSPATIKMNGCQYLLHLEAELVEGETYTYQAPTDLKCPAGKVVEIETFTSASAHTSGSPFCRFTLGESGNQEREEVELFNRGSISDNVKGSIEAQLDIKGITSKRTLGFFCGTETHTTGTLEGAFEIKGETETKGLNGIGVFPG